MTTTVAIKVNFFAPYDNAETRRICLRDGKEGDCVILDQKMFRIQNKELVPAILPGRVAKTVQELNSTKPDDVIIGSIQGPLRIEWLFPGKEEQTVLIYKEGLFLPSLKQCPNVASFDLDCWKLSDEDLVNYLKTKHGTWGDCALNGTLVQNKKENPNTRVEEKCAICLEADATKRILPCNHKCLCDECASKWKTTRSGAQCPLCNHGAWDAI